MSSTPALHLVSKNPQAAPPERRSRRAAMLMLLRKIHLYLGLWGAGLGLLFGITGILQNHRSIMQIPVEDAVETSTQMALPAGGFASAKDLAKWLQQQTKIASQEEPKIRVQPAKKVTWANIPVQQPERWNVRIGNFKHRISAEYMVGNAFVKVETTDTTPIGTLMQLHTASGVSAFWVLLSDTIAGALIMLCLTGLLMWTQLHTLRTTAVLTSVGALTAGLWYLWTV